MTYEIRSSRCQGCVNGLWRERLYFVKPLIIENGFSFHLLIRYSKLFHDFSFTYYRKYLQTRTNK